jgi:hypothetical protein
VVLPAVIFHGKISHMSILTEKRTKVICLIHLSTTLISSFYFNALCGLVYAVWLTGCIILGLLLVRTTIKVVQRPTSQERRSLCFAGIWLATLFGMQWAGAVSYRAAFPFLHKSALTKIIGNANWEAPGVRIISKNPLQIHVYRKSLWIHAIYIYSQGEPSSFYVGRSNLKVEALGDRWYRVMLTPITEY